MNMNMYISKATMVVLVLGMVQQAVAQQPKIKKYSVQEFAQYRSDWRPNLAESEIMVLENGFALGGYDPVSFLTKQKATMGLESIHLDWKGATWLFESKENRKLFMERPDDYVPQYGGWSLYQMAGNGGEGYATQSKPEDSWLVFGGKLYLLHRADWAEHLRNNEALVSNLIEFADKQWPDVRIDVAKGKKVFWPSLRPEDSFDSHEMRPILAPTEIMVLHNGYAIGGYDPVAYFEIGEATKGNEAFSYEWKDAIWLFDSQKHLDLFKADPDKYAPQYGGWCSYGMSGHGGAGYGAQTDPKNSWSILDGKLYLNWAPGVKQMFLQNSDKYIKDADLEWERVRQGILQGQAVHWRYF
jgi:YHS domain-containing protein